MADDQNAFDEHKDVPADSEITETEPAADTAAGQQSEPQAGEEPADEAEDSYEPVLIVPQPVQPYGWRQKFSAHKKIILPVFGVVAALALVAAIPYTRYKAAGLVITRDFSVTVVDKENGTYVTSATVQLGDKKVQTDNNGSATISYAPGGTRLTVSKKYYRSQDQTVTVPIGSQREPVRILLEATGRQVPVTVTNSISGQPLANATIKAAGTEAKTDEAGKTIIVLPTGQAVIDGTVSMDGYNTAAVQVTVTTDAVIDNIFKLTPEGRLYFLSNASGRIDVVKTNLDGTDRQTVLAGTGKEDKYNTILLASRDWKYVALLSKRDGGQNAKVFVIDTATDKLNTADEGDAMFTFIGWSGDRLVYTVRRNDRNEWEPEQQALKSYHAPAKKIITLDETAAEGTEDDYTAEYFGSVYVLSQEVVYVKDWYAVGAPDMAGKQGTFNSIKADGGQKKVVKAYEYPSEDYYYYGLEANLADNDEVNVQFYGGDVAVYDTYKNGTITSVSMTSGEFYDDKAARIVSPSGKKEFWSEMRDGRNVFFVADRGGANGKQLGSSDEMVANGWYTDSYVLMAFKSRELRILPAAGMEGGVGSSLKVSDFYQPNNGQYGYGY